MTDAEITPPTKKAPAKRGQKRKQVEEQQEDGQQVGYGFPCWKVCPEFQWTNNEIGLLSKRESVEYEELMESYENINGKYFPITLVMMITLLISNTFLLLAREHSK